MAHYEGFTLDFVFHKGVSHFNRLSIERCQRFDHQTLVVWVSPDGAKAVKQVNEQFGMPPESAASTNAGDKHGDAAASGTDTKQKKETQRRRGEDEAGIKEN